MFKWEEQIPQNQPLSDVTTTAWYYKYVETALHNGAIEKEALFKPLEPIKREEMAIMLVRALGLTQVAKDQEKDILPFTDVKENIGYIAVAYDIGMSKGTSETTFSPKAGSTREECANMITRIYEKYFGKTDFTHGFYAISSYAQRDFVKNTVNTTLLWSKMTLDERGV